MMRRRRGRRQNSNSVSGSEGAQSAAEGSQQASSVAVTHRDVVDALIGVCEEAGMPLGAVGLFLKPMGDGPAAVLDYRGEDRSAPEYPPSIRVDVSGHARDVIRGSIIDAIVEAAHGEPVGAGNSAVVVDLSRCGPMLSPRVPNHVPIPGPRMERVTPGQRPRPHYGHPHESEGITHDAKSRRPSMGGLAARRVLKSCY